MTTHLQLIVDTLAASTHAIAQENPSTALQTKHGTLTDHIAETYPDVLLRNLQRRPHSEDVREMLVEDLTDAGAVDDPTLAHIVLDLAHALQRAAPAAPQAIGVDLSEISAKSLNIADVESDGPGVRLTAADIAEDVKIQNITSGDSPADGGLSVDISNTKVGGALTIGIDKARAEREARAAYLNEVASECNLLPWKVIHSEFSDPDQGDEMGLADIYTDLDTTDLREIEREADDGELQEEDLRRMMRGFHAMTRVPAQTMTDEAQRLLMMGDPGSGKSTFVKHLAYTLTQARLTADADHDPAERLATIEPWSHGALLPVRIELRQVAAFAHRHETSQGDLGLLRRYLKEQLDEMGQSGFWPQMARLLQTVGGKRKEARDGSADSSLDNSTGVALFLLDGLDEVPTSQRQLVVDMVNDVAKRLPRHRYLVTCRPYAYVGQPWQLTHFTLTSLAPFNRAQIDRFVTNWYHRLADRSRMAQSDADDRLRRLLGAMDRPDLLGLAERPLLLTVMTQLHTFKNQLPDSRVELYEDAVELLLQRWESRSGQQSTLLEEIDLPGLKMSDLKAGLYEVAYKAHAADQNDREEGDGPVEETADIDEGDLRQWLAPYLGGSWDKAGLFIDYIRERAGLLIRHKTEAYTFPHRTFQEYLAACYLINGDDYPTTAASLVCGDRSRWREVFLLSVGQAPLGQAIAAVNSLCPTTIGVHNHDQPDDQPDEDAWQTALLAGQTLKEIGTIALKRRNDGQALLERIRTSLTGVIQAVDCLAPKERATGGQLLGRLGDQRKEIMTLEQMQFCHVPAGPFRMGSPEDDEEAEESEKPIHTVDLDYGYWVGRYPVSCAQFGEFATAENYKNPAYWSEAAAHGLWEDGRLQGYAYEFNSEKDEWEYNQKTLDGAYNRGEPWNLPNHPRVDVTWYEALAFCRWLNERASTDGWLSEGYQITLPSEAEWEKAARGGIEIPAQPLMACLERLGQNDQTKRALKTNPQSERRYPWGNDWESARVSFHGTELGQTTTSGTFAQGISPYEVEEMAGTVLDWTRSLWGTEVEKPDFPYPYIPTDGREALEPNYMTIRIIRGGSWGTSKSLCRSAARYWNFPHLRDDHLGFRCVVVPISG